MDIVLRTGEGEPNVVDPTSQEAFSRDDRHASLIEQG